LCQTRWPRAGDTGILPHIREAAAILAEIEVVDVRCGSGFPDEDEFMATAVERSHSAVLLGPDTDIFQFRVRAIARGHHLFDAAPIHTNVVDRSIRAVRRQITESGG